MNKPSQRIALSATKAEQYTAPAHFGLTLYLSFSVLLQASDIAITKKTSENKLLCIFKGLPSLVNENAHRQ